MLVAAVVFGLIVLRLGVTREGLEQAFLASVALAVAAVPEGLATVVTVALALGVRRMAGHGAIVRRLPAVETLGSTTVILTDKTGTLTENRMRVESILLAEAAPRAYSELPPEVAVPLAEIASLCNDATLEPPSGDPLDLALLEAVGPRRISELRRLYPRLDGKPFESERKRMTTFHSAPEGGGLLLVKGAPEVILPRCTERLAPDGSTRPLDAHVTKDLLSRIDDAARRGMRVLALARRHLPDRPSRLETSESHLTLAGLVALRDPLRKEAAATVDEAHAAGVRIIMVTGDHAGTATWVAEEAGLLKPGGAILTGESLRRLGLPDDPTSIAVYARVDPDQKLALALALKAHGHVVAVTGDGVNDAPALQKADIGVAMGKGGTDVAREASDLVITDDNLATIVTAVREGRGIYDNIRKVVDYLVAGNLSEILVVVTTLLAFPSLGVPLLPLQLLWINLLTDGLPALALGVDPVNPGLMRRPPRTRSEHLLGRARVSVLGTRALLIGGAAVASLAIERYVWAEPWEHARAMMFTVLVWAHVLYAFVVHGSSGRNPWLLLGVGLGLFLQFLITLWPPAQRLFHTAPLLPREWMLAIVAGVFPLGVMIAFGRLLTLWRHYQVSWRQRWTRRIGA